MEYGFHAAIRLQIPFTIFRYFIAAGSQIYRFHEITSSELPYIFWNCFSWYVAKSVVTHNSSLGVRYIRIPSIPFSTTDHRKSQSLKSVQNKTGHMFLDIPSSVLTVTAWIFIDHVIFKVRLLGDTNYWNELFIEAASVM